ncbi:hypothetical protein N7532_007702 [Penicillium argentinense]|uniref:Uncharacterized protein n=1 Tax=Penicillium argentinense TaxID=1131581 RepID=A0A9W9EW13_9EURO|nr:uncharacterized protein N7532_007702 [Penicillium argentinense]KAJ5089018.1 hypothetical protein N7532_007702 [Penicillium argentinense]
MTQHSCGCDLDRTGESVYLGPDEGPEHQNDVQLAYKSSFQERKADFHIRSEHNRAYYVSVHKSDVARESQLLAPLVMPRQGERSVSTVTLQKPVLMEHLIMFGQFLSTGDYAIKESDVLGFTVDTRKSPNVCYNCMCSLRLLGLHLSIFHAARYLGMDTLQLLVMQKFCAISDHVTSTVLRYITQEVYTIELSSQLSLYPGMYSLAGWPDYRPLLVLPAIMNYIRRHKPAIELHYDIMVVDDDAPWPHIEKFRAAYEETDQFMSIRYRIPEFDGHMSWAEMVLSEQLVQDEPPQQNRFEPIGDLLDFFEKSSFHQPGPTDLEVQISLGELGPSLPRLAMQEQTYSESIDGPELFKCFDDFCQAFPEYHSL